jgi:hypothetical protein
MVTTPLGWLTLSVTITPLLQQKNVLIPRLDSALASLATVVSIYNHNQIQDTFLIYKKTRPPGRVYDVYMDERLFLLIPIDFQYIQEEDEDGNPQNQPPDAHIVF